MTPFSIKEKLFQITDNSHQSDGKSIYGHDFHIKESTSDMDRYCEVCTALVWGVIQSWYSCLVCGICCHDKCLNLLKRMCASVRVNEGNTLSMTICPDPGLMSQNYTCFECRAPISYKPGETEPRQCDYTGNYYCPTCHWNDEMIIPARVVHNWDLEPRKVCRATKQFLRLMYIKPVLFPEKVNPRLPNFVEELSEMKRLRQEILLMKTYFLSCQSALQAKLLLMLKRRQHFVENVDSYTMADIVDLVNEKLLREVIKVHASFASHIKVECDTCRGKGYFCEICGRSEIIFPFDNICVSCPDCYNVFHSYCFAKTKTCPRCERRKSRQAENERKAELLRQIEVSWGSNK